MSMESPWEVEEERRLLYVAITRAKRFCMMSYASSRFRNGMTVQTNPSRFLRDISAGLLHFVTGSELPNPNAGRAARNSFHSPAPSFQRPVSPRPAPGQPFRSTIPAGIELSADAENATTHQAWEVEPGMRIEHNRFGKGEIIDVDTSQPDAKIRVKFDNVEVKTLLLKFAKFNILQS